MGTMTSPITSLAIVYSTVYSGVDQKKTSKLRATGLCVGKSPENGEFLAQRASYAENVSISWRYYVIRHYYIGNVVCINSSTAAIISWYLSCRCIHGFNHIRGWLLTGVYCNLFVYPDLIPCMWILNLARKENRFCLTMDSVIEMSFSYIAILI